MLRKLKYTLAPIFILLAILLLRPAGTLAADGRWIDRVTIDVGGTLFHKPLVDGPRGDYFGVVEDGCASFIFAESSSSGYIWRNHEVGGNCRFQITNTEPLDNAALSPGSLAEEALAVLLSPDNLNMFPYIEGLTISETRNRNVWYYYSDGTQNKLIRADYINSSDVYARRGDTEFYDQENASGTCRDEIEVIPPSTARWRNKEISGGSCANAGTADFLIGRIANRPDLEAAAIVPTAVQSNCDGGALGWIICPIIEGISRVVDIAKNQFIIPFLETQPLEADGDPGTAPNSDGDPANPIFLAWRNARNIANIILIPVFFFLIFAQALSINLDAYTVKKMLPRLVAAAILIQFSFYIVGFLIDVANVLGSGIENLLGTIEVAAPAEGVGGVADTVRVGTGWLTTSGLTIAGLLIAGGIIVHAGFLFVIAVPLLIGALAVILTLIARQLLIVLLVMVAPVAFVSWVLPNTGKLFKVWWDNLIRVLMMYPLIVALFAAGSIVSAVLTNDLDLSTAGGVQGIAEGVARRVAAVIAVAIPLLAVPFTFKFGGTVFASMAGGIQKGRQWAMGGEKGDRRLGAAIAKRRTKAHQKLTGMQSGGGMWQKLTNPFSMVPKDTRIPVLRKLGNSARSRARTGVNLQMGDAKKALEGMSANEEMLKGLTRAGRSEKIMREYIWGLRRAGKENEADMVEKVYESVGGVAMQAQAAKMLSESGKVTPGDMAALARGVRDPGLFAELADEIGSNNAKNGAPGYAAFEFDRTPDGRVDPDSVRLALGKANQRISGLGKEDLVKASASPDQWAGTREGLVRILSGRGHADPVRAADLQQRAIRTIHEVINPESGYGADTKLRFEEVLHSLNIRIPDFDAPSRTVVAGYEDRSGVTVPLEAVPGDPNSIPVASRGRQSTPGQPTPAQSPPPPPPVQQVQGGGPPPAQPASGIIQPGQPGYNPPSNIYHNQQGGPGP
ncbi:hypothetical protein HY346_03055 [Candidatus Microgenomates bacterium]|nr:hypothetical protein [Candidatus Microgenomates bacterium]